MWNYCHHITDVETQVQKSDEPSHRTGKNKDLNPMLTSHPGLYSTPQNKSNYKKLFSRKGRRESGKGTKRKEEAENAERLCLSATE